MEVILLSVLRGTGKAGEIVTVRGGFGRYLVAAKRALAATKTNLEAVEARRASLQFEEQRELERANAAMSSLVEPKLAFGRAVSRNGRLFGSVGKRDIAAALTKLFAVSGASYTVTHAHVLLQHPIKEEGVVRALVSLHPEASPMEVIVSVAPTEELASMALQTLSKAQQAPDADEVVAPAA